MSAEQLQAACGEAHAQGLRVLVHAHAAAAMALAIDAGCDQIEHGVFATPEVLARMARQGTVFSPQCGLVFRNYLDNRARYEGIGNYNAAGFASMEQALPLAVEAIRKALATPGLKVVFGTDAVAGAHGRNVDDLICRVNEAGQRAGMRSCPRHRWRHSRWAWPIRWGRCRPASWRISWPYAAIRRGTSPSCAT